MALFKNTYSGLITGGLGMAACCGMITMGFHLFKCTIEVLPPVSGGGGSQPSSPEYLIPYKFNARDYTVKITVQFKDGKKTTKSYKVTKKRADLYVKIANWSLSVQQKVQVGVQSFKRVAKTITTSFKTDK